jgi:hypothetical protein
LREERLREPYLVAFRSTREEIEKRKIEDSLQRAFKDEFGRFPERLRAGDERRFERYLIRQSFIRRFLKKVRSASARGARTSAAKAAFDKSMCGTAEAVPLSKTIARKCSP